MQAALSYLCIREEPTCPLFALPHTLLVHLHCMRTAHMLQTLLHTSHTYS